MDVAVWNNQGDAMKNRHRLKRPSHLQRICHRYDPFLRQSVPSNQYDDGDVSLQDLQEVADLLTKMNYRICDDGFYIPSPAAPTDNATFTFDGLYPDETAINQIHFKPLEIGKKSIIHSLGHHTKETGTFAEANVCNLMDSIFHQNLQEQQQLLSLPSCQYSPRSSELHFTPNIAESIMTEELSTNYDNIPDINEKPPNESILDDALVKIEARDDEEESSTWKAKEEKETWRPEERDAILSLANPDKSWRKPELTTHSCTKHAQETVLASQAIPEVERTNSQTTPEVERSHSQTIPEVERTTSQTSRRSGLTVLKEIGRTAVKVVGKCYVCDICSRGFAQSSTMRNHRRTHTGERPFQCDVCKRSFCDMSTLRKHRRVHTKDKPFTCDICDMAFAQSGNLYRHKRTMHPNDV